MNGLAEWFKPELIWFLLGLGLLLLEFALPGLIVFFFGLGAIFVAVLCMAADLSLNAQLTIFLISSILLLVFLRSWLRKVFLGHVASTQDGSEDLAEFLGEKAVVVKAIAADIGGRVEFRGTHWDATADDDIAVGTPVEIVGKSNITLKVKPR